MDTLTVQEYKPQTVLESKALALLGLNHPQEAVANALGVSPSRISQLMSIPEFAAEVTKKRYEVLRKHTDRDSLRDEIEDALLLKLKKSLPLLQKPMEINKVLKDINASKRQSASANPSGTIVNQQVINLTIPAALIRKYKTNSMSQVIEVDDKPFLTAPSEVLETTFKELAHNEPERIESDPPDGTREAEPVTARTNFKASRVGSTISADDL